MEARTHDRARKFIAAERPGILADGDGGNAAQLDLHNITCPAYLLAGADDDITTPEQVLDAAKYIGTAEDRIVQGVVPGGHIGLFIGGDTLRGHWPQIARWIGAQQTIHRVDIRNRTALGLAPCAWG